MKANIWGGKKIKISPKKHGNYSVWLNTEIPSEKGDN